MGIKLNPKTPNEKVTQTLREMGLEFDKNYTVHWSQYGLPEWELRHNKEMVISLKPSKIELLIKSNILVRSL